MNFSNTVLVFLSFVLTGLIPPPLHASGKGQTTLSEHEALRFAIDRLEKLAPREAALLEAKQFRKQEDFAKALQAYQALRTQATQQSYRDELSMQVIEVLVALGEFDRAATEMRHLASREVPYPPALVEQARLHLEVFPEKAGTLETVERGLRKAGAHTVRASARAQSQWAALAAARGRFGMAKKRYRQVFEDFPGHPVASKGLARVYLRQGKIAEARQVMAECLAANPKHAESHWFAGSLILSARSQNGWTGAIKGTPEEDRALALGHFQDAMAYAPETSRYQGSVMLVHYLDQNVISAEPLLTLLESEAPHGSYTWLGRGMRAEISGRVGEAEEAYKQALAQDDRNRWAHFFLGGIETGRGNPELTGEEHNATLYAAQNLESGRKHMSRAIRGAPEFPYREAALSLLID